jgi:peroxin-6
VLIYQVECYDIVGDTAATLEGTIRAQLEKAKSCTPSVLVLHHVEAFGRRSDQSTLSRPLSVVKVLEDALTYIKESSVETGWPCILLGTTADVEAVPSEILGCFKQEIDVAASIVSWNLVGNADTCSLPPRSSGSVYYATFSKDLIFLRT